MKKALIILLTLSALTGGYFLWLRWSPDRFIDGYYLVPSDAVMIVETEDPVGNWQHFSSGEMWQGLRGFPPFEKITEKADLMDEVIRSNQQVFALLGRKHLLISVHMTKAKDYGFVYYADMKEASKSGLIKASITSLIRQFDYVHTVRDYKGTEVNEYLDPKSRDVLSLAYLKNYLVCTYDKALLERVIETSSDPATQMGTDTRFTEVNRLTSVNGMCRVFLNYATFDRYLGVYMDDLSDVRDLFSGLYFSGLDCRLESDRINADGYTLINDSLSSYLQALSVSGKSASDAEKILSDRASLFIALGFSDFGTFYENLQKKLVTHSEEYRKQQTALRKLERQLNISLQKNFFDWIGPEIALAQYETDLLIGNKVRSVVAIRARDMGMARENLALIEKQIRKRTPIRFTEVVYNGHEIRYLEVKGLFRAVLGKLFSKIDKPYYTILGDYVVFSDDPRTLLLTIDDYAAQRTLSNSEDYRDFRSGFPGQISALAYLSPDRYYNNFRGLLNPESWKSTEKNKPYVRCFAHLGLSLTGDGDRMRTVIDSRYRPWTEPVMSADTTVDEADTLSAMDLFLIRYFQGNMNTVYYENGNPRYTAEMEGNVMDGAYVEYYEHAVIRIKGRYRNGVKHGTWKYFKPDGSFDYKEKYTDGVLKRPGLLERIFGSGQEDE